MIKLLKKLPIGISIPLFYLVVSLALLFRFFFTSVYGALILALGLYYYVKYFTSVEPFTPEELLLWTTSISPEYKVALFSSFITITGFVIAFHTATLNWKDQMKAQLKSKASDDIDHFFHIVLSNISSAEIYIKSQVRIVNDIQNGAPLEEISSRIEYQQGKTHSFFAARDVLSEAAVEIHRLIGSNYNLLSTNYGQIEKMNDTAESLRNINDKLWLHVPVVSVNDDNHIQSFFNQVNVTDYNEFLNVCEVNSGKIAGLTGAIRGALSSAIWGFSFPQFVNLVSIRKDFKKTMKNFRDDLNS